MVKKKTASVKLKWRSRSSRGKVEVKILTTETDMEAASSRNQPTRGILERNTARALCGQCLPGIFVFYIALHSRNWKSKNRSWMKLIQRLPHPTCIEKGHSTGHLLKLISATRLLSYPTVHCERRKGFIQASS
ncbi:unnamed protein product [Microthlaspi erraticum]|uniref:Uncharacterized protein n=1 Tax=Microthlaspi erraticum TaxID=1685480 RepID=A0A6D2IM08_9BRAS|nr:unnamed protein product [Microthlaspi erraticum]CAA7030100.1 unnamed protein product [Microthlaspi erraticum]